MRVFALDKETPLSRLGEIQNRFQFLIVLVLFFPTVLNALEVYNSSSAVDVNYDVLRWGEALSVYILSYLIITVLGSRIHSLASSIVNALVLLGIASLVPILIIFKEFAKSTISGVLATAFVGSFLIWQLIPVTIFLILSIDTAVVLIKYFHSNTK